jgi:hypothetical protein
MTPMRARKLCRVIFSLLSQTWISWEQSNGISKQFCLLRASSARTNGTTRAKYHPQALRISKQLEMIRTVFPALSRIREDDPSLNMMDDVFITDWFW